MENSKLGRGSNRYATRRATAALLGLLVVGAAYQPRPARADCWIGAHCDTDYCDINCSDDREYIAFGTYVDGYTTKIGVCWWSFSGTWGKGACGGCIGTTVNAADWRIFAGSGADLLRLAERSGGESCNTFTIDGDFAGAGSDTYYFRGDDGADRIYLYDNDSASAPPTSDCHSGGRADGRADGDYIYGSAYTDRIWGSGGIDSIWGWGGGDIIEGGDDMDYIYGGDGGDNIWGQGGGDTIRGNDGDDWISGGDGVDKLYGDDDDDTLLGDADCDVLDGGADSDACLCGTTDTWGEGTTPTGCERYVSGYYSYNCPGCS